MGYIRKREIKKSNELYLRKRARELIVERNPIAVHVANTMGEDIDCILYPERFTERVIEAIKHGITIT